MSAAPRRRLLLAAGSVAALAAAGCSTSPPTRWYELRLDAPEAPWRDAQPPPACGAVWELSPGGALPAALERDTLVVASGAAGLLPLAGHRWAAPLREAVPRVLLHDLQQLRGPGRVWAAPAPAGVQATQRLRVDLLGLQAGSDRRTLRLHAQWTWQALPAIAAPTLGNAVLQLALADDSVDTLAAGHRLLLWRLAQQVLASGLACGDRQASVPPPCPRPLTRPFSRPAST